MITKYDLMMNNNEELLADEEFLANKDKLDSIRHFYTDLNEEINLRYHWGEDPAKSESYIPRIFDEINIECDTIITLDIIKKYEEYISKDWEYFFKRFQDKFPEEIYDEIDVDREMWKVIFIFQSLSETFLRSHENIWDSIDYAWDYISYYQLSHLPVSFIYDYEDKINFYLYSHKHIDDYNKHEWALPFDIIMKHRKELDFSRMDFGNEEFVLEKYLDKEKSNNPFSDYSIYNWIDDAYKRISVASRKNLSEDFIEKHLDYLDLDLVFFNHDSQLSDEFIERHRDIVPWKYISMNYTFSLDFLDRNRKYIYANLYNQSHPELYDEVEKKAWDELSSIYPFSIDELNIYKDKINWENYLKGDAFRFKENDEKRLIIDIFYDKYIEKVIPYLTEESIIGSDERWNDMDKIAGLMSVADKTKLNGMLLEQINTPIRPIHKDQIEEIIAKINAVIDEGDLKEETEKKLAELRDNLKKYMTNV